MPIHSLPQEWLWCETWCGNTTKPAAKTIDLCNNPLTKVAAAKAGDTKVNQVDLSIPWQKSPLPCHSRLSPACTLHAHVAWWAAPL